MNVHTRVEQELEDAADDWRKALALTLARDLDDRPNASMAAELRRLMDELLDDAEPEVSTADDLRARRAARLAAAKPA